MFAKTIIDSDAFLDMPLSAQSLYFHLSMRADDEGFLNNPKKIQRMIGASDDDLKLLIAKKFLIPFESGIVVIKHWYIHNYIQNDRRKETVYVEEKNMLRIKENKVYTLDDSKMDTLCIQDVSKMDSQDRLGKDRLGKDSIREEKSAPDYQEIIQAYNEICVSFPRLRTLSDARKKAIRARLKQYTIDDFLAMFKKVEASTFLKGGNNRNWSATFDWMVKDSNMAKILDGNYDNKGKSGMMQNTYTKEQMEELEKQLLDN